MKLAKVWMVAFLAATLLLPAACNRDANDSDPTTQLVTTTSAPPATQPPGPVSFAITSPVDGIVFRTIVIKVEGTVPKNASAVTVNGNPAHVSNGAYFAFIELSEGQNTVEVSANVSGTVLTAKRQVSFVRPLAVFLTDVIEPGVDYLVSPLTFTGFATLPQASVAVDGTQVAVRADGSFIINVMVNQPQDTIKATAILGTETDTATIALLFMDGQLYPGPSYPFDNRSPELQVIRTVSVTHGGETTVELTLKPNRSIKNPQSSSFIVHGTGSGTLPGGLQFTFYPESFTAYPNAVYNLMFSVTASKDMAPGVYSSSLEANFAGGTGISVPITIEVR